MKNKDKFIEIFAWYGMVAVLIAYFISTIFISNKYQQLSLYIFSTILNLTGSVGLLIKSIKTSNNPGNVLNIVWIIIAIIAIIQILFNK